MDASDFIGLVAKAGNTPKAAPSLSVEARRLLDHYSDYTKVHKFQRGDLVKLKTGLRCNFRYPHGDRPGIVFEVLDPPLAGGATSPCTAGSLLDLRIGVLDDDGDLILFCYPSQLFEPYDGPIEA
jgi:hypothetical protein